MRVNLPYRRETISVCVDDARCAGVVYPNDVSGRDERTVILSALDKPSGSLSLADCLGGNDDILVLVNDATRPTPTARILAILKERIPLSRCHFLVATGSHRMPDDGELRWIFGEEVEELAAHGRIHCHDAKNDAELVFFGHTAAGHPVTLNRRVAEARKILVLTTVEPHYFGGYTGGRKSFLPGVAGYETIRLNHRLALKPEAVTLALEGNPVHEEMDSCLDLLKDKAIFTLQMVMDRHHTLVAAAAGDIRISFRQAVAEADRVFCVDVPERADAVVTVAPHPMDIDLYQSQKAVENAKPIVKPGGIIILVSSCRTGIGPDTFYNLMAGCRTPHEVMDRISEEYRLGYHKAAKLVEAAMMGELWAVTDLEPRLLESIFIRPLPDVQTAVDSALKQTGPDSRVMFIPEGSITVPRVVS
ncbi:nickel-dependent lactate racemase [bacterium]|nr:nickel-dependent lactate racemase [candidate division CSSED10-310 bacterium]